MLIAAVDFVGVESFFPRPPDGGIESDEQLVQGLVRATPEHGKAIVIVAGDGDALDGIHIAVRDLATGFDELVQAEKRRKCIVRGFAVDGKTNAS